MNFKKIYLLQLMHLLLINNFPSAATKKTETPTQSKSSQQIPMISEEELKEIMKNAVEEYNRLPDEEKELMSKQIGIKREELDDIMNEASAFVNEMNNKAEITNQTNTFSDSNTIKDTPAHAIPTKKIEKNNKNIIALIEKAIKTLQTLNLKANDEYIKEKINEEFNSAFPIIEKMVYFLYLIKQSLQDTDNNDKINTADINQITNITKKIGNLNDSIEKLITISEYETIHNKNNLFQKYSIKSNTYAELKTFLEKTIEKTKNEINTLKNEMNDNDKKKITKNIIDLEYKLDALEKDFIECETKTLEKKETNNTINEYRKLLQDSIEKITKQLKNILINDNAISEIENIIKKHFPEEYKIGKQKEELLKKQLLEERKIKEQKGIQTDIFLEKNIKISNENAQKNTNESNDNNFQAQSNNNEDNYYEDQEEDLWQFPKEGEIIKPTENKTADAQSNNEQKESASTNEKNPQKKTYQSKRPKNKEKRGKDTDDTDEDKKKIEDIIFPKLVKSISEIKKEIETYLELNATSFKTANSLQLTDTLNKNLEILNETINKLTEDDFTKTKIKPLDLKNPLSTTKDGENAKDDKKKDIPKYIQEELTKISTLSLSDTATKEISNPQQILYLLKELQEFTNNSFSTEKRNLDAKNIAPFLDNLEKTIKNYNNICRQFSTKNTTKETLEYWLLSNEEIATIVEQKKKKTAEETEKNKVTKITNPITQ
jgi:hypothetical protein